MADHEVESDKRRSAIRWCIFLGFIAEVLGVVVIARSVLSLMLLFTGLILVIAAGVLCVVEIRSHGKTERLP